MQRCAELWATTTNLFLSRFELIKRNAAGRAAKKGLLHVHKGHARMSLCDKMRDNEGVQLAIFCNTAAHCAVLLIVAIAKPFPAAHTLNTLCGHGEA